MPALINPILNSAVSGTTRTSSSGGTGVNGSTAMGAAIPGFAGLTSGATDIIRQLMSGLPSAAPTQRANAYFGANSGMPGSDFVRNRGFDLYGQKAEEYKQRGLQDLLSLIQGYSGSVVPTTGEQQRASEFQQEFGFKQAQQGRDDSLARERLRLQEQELLPWYLRPITQRAQAQQAERARTGTTSWS